MSFGNKTAHRRLVGDIQNEVITIRADDISKDPVMLRHTGGTITEFGAQLTITAGNKNIHGNE